MKIEDRKANYQATIIFNKIRNSPNFEQDLDFTLGPGTKDFYRDIYRKMYAKNQSVKDALSLGLTLDEKVVITELEKQALEVGTLGEWQRWKTIINPNNDKKVSLYNSYQHFNKTKKYRKRSLKKNK